MYVYTFVDDTHMYISKPYMLYILREDETKNSIFFFFFWKMQNFTESAPIVLFVLYTFLIRYLLSKCSIET